MPVDLNRACGRGQLPPSRVALVLLAVLLASGDAHAEIRFGSCYQPFGTVANPGAIVTADFNGDGVPDVAVMGLQSTQVLIHPGRPGGGFGPPYVAATFASTVQAIAAADLNRDGRPDLVVGEASGSVWSLLGNGDGTFQAPRGVLSQALTDKIEISDLDGDGIPDLVVLYFTGPVIVMKGRGDGSFQVSSVVSGGAYPRDVAAADLDGDGIKDLMVVDWTNNAVAFIKGLGGGTFGTPAEIPVASEPNGIVAGDFNEDGVPDVAVSTQSAITLLFGTLGALPASRHDIPMASAINSIQSGDLDRDGHLDLVAAGQNTDDVSVLQGRGDGTFVQTGGFAAGSWCSAVTLLDLNGDGRLDVVAADLNDARLALAYGHGDGTFGDFSEFSTGGAYQDLVVGDVNLDGLPDVVVLGGGPAGLGVHLGDGTGGFKYLSTNGPAGFGKDYCAIGDVNGDGFPDVVGTVDNQLGIDQGDGTGLFGPPTSVPLTGNPGSLVIRDFNRDGRPDIAVASSNGIAVLLGMPGGGFTSPVLVGNPAVIVASADFNGDGIEDLISVNSRWGDGFSSQVSVMLGRGDGTFLPAVTVQAGDKPDWVATGDVDGDGIMDFVTANSGDGTISIMRGLGNGHFVALPPVVFARSSCVTLADLDLDGTLDLIATMPDEDMIVVWRGLGGGSFGPPIEIGTRMTPGEVRVADVNGDQLPDLVVGYWMKNVRFDVLLNETQRVSTGVGPGQAPTRFELAPARPNPFRSIAALGFSVPRAAIVRLEIYDLEGRKIRTLQNGPLAPGKYERTWDGATSNGTAAQTGVYFVRFSAPGVEQSRKALLVR